MDNTTALGGQPRRVLAGRYVLQGLLGQGGMADVELAYDEVLDRQVAAKMLHIRYASDPSFQQRFRREAQAAASLNHPNVVGVYDTGSSDGRPFIVMEYVAGRSLRDVLRSEEVLPERAAEIVGEAALALHYAHERGLVHRDIKPANIMISDEGRVKVTDFGIARAVNAETVTQTATVFGTAAYISPEQAQGEVVDRRSDIYSLGVVLYEMLAGRLPFEGDSAVALAYKHISEEPVPPSRLNHEVSPQLDAVVSKAMAKHPDDRYQTARELHDDLRRAVAGMSVSAPPVTAYATTQAVGRDGERRTLVAPPYTPSEDRQQPRYEQKRRRDRGAGIVFFVVVVLLLALGGYFVSSFIQRDPPELVLVPDVTGMDLPAAEQLLEAAGFTTQIGDPEASMEPLNTVVRTEPEMNERAQRGSTITIIPSSGPIPVPDVTGLEPDEAQAALLRAGLVIGAQEQQLSNDIETGRVIGTDPPADTPVAPNTRVTLIVSGGPSTFTMPDVVNLREADAGQRITGACPSAGCVTINTVEQPSDEVQPGQVIATNPAAGTQVPIGGTVTLVISTGPEPEPTQTPPPPDPTPTPPEPTPTPTPTDDGRNGNGNGNRTSNRNRSPDLHDFLR